MQAVGRAGSSAHDAYSCMQMQFGSRLYLKELKRQVEVVKAIQNLSKFWRGISFIACFLLLLFFLLQGFLSASLPSAWWPLPSKDTAPSATHWSPARGRRGRTPIVSSPPPGCCHCWSWCPTRSSASSGLFPRPTTQLATCAAWTGPARKLSRPGESGAVCFAREQGMACLHKQRWGDGGGRQQWWGAPPERFGYYRLTLWCYKERADWTWSLLLTVAVTVSLTLGKSLMHEQKWRSTCRRSEPQPTCDAAASPVPYLQLSTSARVQHWITAVSSRLGPRIMIGTWFVASKISLR